LAEPEIRADGQTITIHDPGRYPDFDARWLEPAWWQAEGARTHSITGRGGVLMLDRPDETWVYRHYHRGGMVSRLIYDRYLWVGIEGSRPVREFRLLDALGGHALPSPRPVAARAVRSGWFYRADILTVLLPGTRPLSSRFGAAWQDESLWPKIGTMVAGFHAAGCDHPDLTAHNILIDESGEPYLVDFDNARLRPPGPWRQAGIDRLRRSLNKVALETGTAFSEAAWQALVGAYERGRSNAE
jgi:3-deoxy-D-manno-octulosonic acid kinase